MNQETTWYTDYSSEDLPPLPIGPPPPPPEHFTLPPLPPLPEGTPPPSSPPLESLYLLHFFGSLPPPPPPLSPPPESLSSPYYSGSPLPLPLPLSPSPESSSSPLYPGNLPPETSSSPYYYRNLFPPPPPLSPSPESSSSPLYSGNLRPPSPPSSPPPQTSSSPYYPENPSPSPPLESPSLLQYRGRSSSSPPPEFLSCKHREQPSRLETHPTITRMSLQARQLPLKKRKLTEDDELSFIIQKFKEEKELKRLGENISYPALRQMSIADVQQGFPKVRTLAARKLYPN